MGTITDPVFIDLSLVGGATNFSARIPAQVRRKLHEGDQIVVYGDAVDPIPAIVTHVEDDDPNVFLEPLAS